MTERRSLVSAAADPWLVGGAAVAFWGLFTLSKVTHRSGIPGISGAFYGIVIGAVACHFGISYHLAYIEEGGGPRRHPAALIGLPVTLAGVVVAVGVAPHSHWLGQVMRVLVTAVFATTIWHYIKQSYGVSRLAAALAGIRLSRYESFLLRYGLYPLWGLSLARLATRGRSGAMFGYPVGVSLVGPWLETVTRIAALGVGMIFAVMIVRRRPPLAVWMPGAAAFLWIGWQPSYASTALVLAAAHAVQYLACVYRAERQWSEDRHQAQPVLWLLCVFGAATVGGLFASMWMASLASSLTGIPAGSLTAALFVFLNLHHYAIDAVIWRSSGTHVRRILAPPAANPRWSLARA